MRGRLALAATFIALLSVCARAADEGASGYQGPSEADIRAAYGLKLDWLNGASREFLNEETAQKLQIKLLKLDFIDCDPITDRIDHYLCGVLVETALGGSAPDAKRIELVMIKDGEVWKTQ